MVQPVFCIVDASHFETLPSVFKEQNYVFYKFLNGQRMKDNVLSIYGHYSSQPIPVQWLTHMIKFHSFGCSSIQLLTTLAYTELASTSARQGHI